jgi:hypothetical protein
MSYSCLDRRWLRGFWLVAVFLLTTVTAFAEDADTRDTLSPFGVLDFLQWNHKWNDYQYPNFKDVQKSILLMKEAGVGIIRLDMNMIEIQPTADKFSFEYYDRIVDFLLENNIRVVGLLGYNAPWTGKEWNDPPDSGQFVPYAQQTVRHFKDRIKYWEICNEPDHKLYWTKQDGMQAYTQLLKATTPVLKKEDPACVVLMGGLTETYSIALKQIYQNGGKEYFDIVNIHPFVDPKLANAMESLEGIHKGVLKVMEKYQDSKKEIWWTEIGCPGLKHPDTTNGWWHGIGTTEKQQADWVGKVYGEPLKWKGIKKIFWAFFRDTRHFNNGVDYFGLISRDFEKKPAFYAYQAVVKKYSD